MSHCVVILRTPPFWSVRVASCNFKLLPITHSKRYDVQLGIILLSSTSQKIYTWNNLARVTDEEQNGPGLWEFAGERGSDSAKTAY